MATKQRAEVEVVDSEGKRHTFRLGTGAICHLEETLGLDITELFKTLQAGRVKVTQIREFVRAGSIDKPNLEMTVEEANEIVDACGVMPLVDAFTDSILLTFNTKGDTKHGSAKAKRGTGEKGNPRRAAAGSASSSAPQK